MVFRQNNRIFTKVSGMNSLFFKYLLAVFLKRISFLSTVQDVSHILCKRTLTVVEDILHSYEKEIL